MSLKSAIKAVMRRVFKDYELNRIYSKELPEEPHEASPPENIRLDTIVSKGEIAKASDKRIRDHASYAGEHAHGFGIWEDDDLICMCWFWDRDRATLPSRFSALRPDEAVMVDLLTTEKCRGKGHAVLITRFAENRLAKSGKRRLWTWVWHSNTPSIRVFDKAGWTYRWFLAEFKFGGMKDYLRIKLPRMGR